MAVRMQSGKFTIDGQDVFLYGGECHYFRVPKQEWKDRLDKLKAAGCNLVSTYVPWVWHEISEGSYDLTGTTRGERDLKSFLELVAESGLYCIVRPGPYVMAEVRYEGVPTWVHEQYPEVVAKQRGGENHPARIVSYRHPTFLAKVRNWYEVVNEVLAPMQITRGGPVIMYQLCNEIGMLHWVTNTSDFNPDTLKRFGEYLSGRFESVASFNEAYGVEEASFGAFAERFGRGLSENDPSFHTLWGEFWRTYIRDYVGDLRGFARWTGIDVPFIINVHGFKDYSIYSRGTDYPVGLSQLYETVQFDDVVLAGDFYPGHIGYDSYHDLVLASAYTKAVSHPEQPLFSAEFQSGRLVDRPRLYPQDLDLNTRTCVAHGMNALNYYMFAAGENYEHIGLFGRRHEWQAPLDSAGNPGANYWKAQHLGRMFQAIGTRLLNAPKRIHTHIGFHPNDYMTEVVEEREQGMIREIVAKREQAAFDGIVRLLVAANLQFEAVDLLRPIRVQDVPTLWVFSTAYMEAELQSRLAEYVLQGGKLVLYPEIPTKDRMGKPCTVLKDALDLGDFEIVSAYADYVDVLDVDSVLVRQRLRFSRYEGRKVASFTREGGDEVAAYLKPAGRGEILVFGVSMGQDYAYQLEVIRKVAALVGIEGHLSASNDNLSLVERTDGERSFLFVHNYDEVAQSAVLSRDGQTLFGGSEVALEPRGGAIFLLQDRVAPGLVVEEATAEMTGLEAGGNDVKMTFKPHGGSGRVKLRFEGRWTDRGGKEYRDESFLYEVKEDDEGQFHFSRQA
ncbi:beta-galactosidase [Cohnella candidum]|uniref:Beta-galactosidase n=1 Tax=Cohnella candidum TaxID=2674991 RepID=A0A3G3K372_9BACL|nr:beta-galactosidase [Cohnella candidum]AYQ74908.1 beta-galactosidase [Cohnella candidum]